MYYKFAGVNQLNHRHLVLDGAGLGRNGRETDATWRFSNRFGRTTERFGAWKK